MALASYVSSLESLVNKNGNTMQVGLIVASTAALNTLMSATFFKCPSSAHYLYGLSFLLLPGIILALMSLLASNGLAVVIKGLCKKDRDVPRGQAKFGRRKRFWHTFFTNVAAVLANALLAMASWIAMTLLFTEAYSCIRVGPPNKQLSNKIAAYKLEKEKYNAHSKVLGLLLLVCGMSILLVLHLIKQCCSPVFTEKELCSMRKYDEIEAKAVSERFTELMQESAKANAKDNIEKFWKEFEKKETDEGVYNRKAIRDLRQFLALRYPRLDMIGNSSEKHCIQNMLPKNFVIEEAQASEGPTSSLMQNSNV